MTRLMIATVAMLGLASCGIDGAPSRPTSTSNESPISLSGETNIGVVAGEGGRSQFYNGTDVSIAIGF